MLRIAARVVREHAYDAYPIHYDDADCDNWCLADDCATAAESLADEFGIEKADSDV